jgi:hypothetical protein
VTFTASVAALSPGTATPSGTIYFKDGAIILGTAALSGSGQAAYTISALSVGNHIISVEYPGTTSFAVSAASLTQTINKASTATALQSSLISSTYGKAVIFSAAVSALSPGSGTPTGTVTFKDGAKILATINLSSGKAALSMTSLSRGTHIITAVYNGDGNFIVNLSNSVSQVIK